MKCESCGHELTPTDKFCKKCGVQQSEIQPATMQQAVTQQVEMQQKSPPPYYEQNTPPQDEPPASAKKKKSGKFSFLITGIACGMVVMLLLSSLGIVPVNSIGKLLGQAIGNGPLTQMTSSRGAIEGAGFDSPEKAAEAYLEAFRDADLDRMISAFAVESYTDNYNFLKSIETSWSPFMIPRIPSDNSFNYDINRLRRQGDIVSTIEMQYISLFIDETEFDFYTGVSFEKDDISPDSLIKILSDPEYQEALKTIKIVGFIPPSDLSDLYESSSNLLVLERQAERIGADEIQSVAVQFELDGQNYLFLCDALRYGDKWYLLSLHGNLAVLLDLNIYAQGVVPMQSLNLLTPVKMNS